MIRYYIRSGILVVLLKFESDERVSEPKLERKRGIDLISRLRAEIGFFFVSSPSHIMRQNAQYGHINYYYTHAILRLEIIDFMTDAVRLV